MVGAQCEMGRIVGCEIREVRGASEPFILGFVDCCQDFGLYLSEK